MKKALIMIALSTFIVSYVTYVYMKQSNNLPENFDFKHLVLKYQHDPKTFKSTYVIGSASDFSTLLPGEKLRQAKKKVYIAGFIAFLVSLFPAWRAYKKDAYFR